MILHKSKVFFTSFAIFLFTSCEDFVEIDPPRTEIVTESLFESDQGANSAINGLYSQLVEANTENVFNAGLEIFTGLYSDELVNLSDDIFRIEFESSEINPLNSNVNTIFWESSYTIINSANSIIEGLRGTSLNSEVRDQVLGEALFIRAMTHFYLVNLFGQIPLVLSTNIELNETISKSSVDEIYDQIEADLLEAQSLMLEDYSFTSNRARPNRLAATALLARLYLYLEDWNNAEIQATKLIERSDLYQLQPDVNNVFTPGSTEAIWNLVPEPLANQVRVAFVFNLPSFTPFSVWINALRPEFLDSFNSSDSRLTNWVDTINGRFIYPNKYKFGFGPFFPEPQEFLAVLRLAELYLIRAEARAQQGNIVGAQEDLNIIRNRAGLANTTASDQSALLDNIFLERKHELFVEFGHRWLDLKRTGRASSALSTVPGKNWQDTDLLWPLPEEELLINPNLLPQNLGY